jgi:hypothetical protein
MGADFNAIIGPGATVQITCKPVLVQTHKDKDIWISYSSDEVYCSGLALMSKMSWYALKPNTKVRRSEDSPASVIGRLAGTSNQIPTRTNRIHG